MRRFRGRLRKEVAYIGELILMQDVLSYKGLNWHISILHTMQFLSYDKICVVYVASKSASRVLFEMWYKQRI